MAKYYIDTEGATAFDPDGGGLDAQGNPISEQLNNQIDARVYRGSSLIGQAENINFPWTTPIDTEVNGIYRIEYSVTDNRGDTAKVSREIQIVDGLLTDSENYKQFYNSVAGGVFQSGYFQSLSPNGDWAACSFLGHWAGESDTTFPTIEYNLRNNSFPYYRITRNAHGAIVFNKNNMNEIHAMQALDILGYWKISGKIYGPTAPLDRVSGQFPGTKFREQIGQKIRWDYQGNSYEAVVNYVFSDVTIVLTESVPYDSLPRDLPSSSYVDCYTTAYSEAPGKDGQIADITLPDSSAPNIVPQVPIVINGSPYTRARNMGTLQAPEGFAWSMRYENDQWIVDSLFSTPLSVGSYRRFGKNVEISSDGSTIAIAATNYVYIYKRSSVFTHLIFQRASSSPSTPTSTNQVPSGWSLSDPGGVGNLYVSRGKSSNNGASYSWSSVYLVSQPDFPHSGNIHPSVSSDYGWNLIGTINGGTYHFGDSISFSKNGNIIVIGDPDPDFPYDGSANGSNQVKVYEYDGSSWNQKGSAIESRNSSHYGYYSTSQKSSNFGRTVDCDDSGLTVVVGGYGWYVNDSHDTYEKYNGSVNCYVFVNGQWETDSIGVYGHGDIFIPNTQTSTSSRMYAQPTSNGSYWAWRHGHDVAISGDGERMYAVSLQSMRLPNPPNWDSSRQYMYNEIVFHNGTQYISIRSNNTGNEPEGTGTYYWEDIDRYWSVKRWILGKNESYQEITRGSVIIYKKVPSSANSGFYWYYDGLILPPRHLGYNGWYTDTIESVGVSDDKSSILIGSSKWQKYNLLGEENAGQSIGLAIYDENDERTYYPGGFAFASEIGRLDYYPGDSYTYSTFISENSSSSTTTVPPQYLNAPTTLQQFAVVKSLTPDDSFIIYINHNSQSVRDGSYVYYINETDASTPPIDASTNTETIDDSWLYQSIEIVQNNINSGYIFVRIYSGYTDKTSDWSSSKFYNSSLSINATPPEPFGPFLYLDRTDKKVNLSWGHKITDSNGNPLTVQNQAEQYSIWDSENSFLDTVSADYSLSKQVYTCNQELTKNYSSPSPDTPAAHIKTFYVRAKNSHSESSAVESESIYTYDWDQNVAPGVPANFTTNVTIFNSNWKAILMDFRIPYDGYFGGEPTSFEFYKDVFNHSISYLNNNPGLLNQDFKAEIEAAFEDSANIKTDGFRHSVYAQDPDTYSNYIYMGDLNVGTTYYFWVRAVNGLGASSWVASSTGGVTVT